MPPTTFAAWPSASLRRRKSSYGPSSDFRVAGKIFATLGYPEDGWAMVKLTPIEQEMFVKAQPAVFKPLRGAWAAVAPQTFA